MSETAAVMWIGRTVTLAAFCAALWWAGVFTDSPNWRLYLTLAGLGIVHGIGSFLCGFAACAKAYNVEERLKREARTG